MPNGQLSFGCSAFLPHLIPVSFVLCRLAWQAVSQLSQVLEDMV